MTVRPDDAEITPSKAAVEQIDGMEGVRFFSQQSEHG
jgi:hypothetical protein